MYDGTFCMFLFHSHGVQQVTKYFSGSLVMFSSLQLPPSMPTDCTLKKLQQTSSVVAGRRRSVKCWFHASYYSQCYCSVCLFHSL